MKLKTLLPLLLITLISMSSCLGNSQTEPEIDKTTLTDELAVYYYKLKVKGNYKECISNMNSCDSTTDKYKNRMHDMLKHHANGIKSEKQGVDSIFVTRKQYNAQGNIAYVFLNVRYKDQTQEEILLPLVRKDNEWHLR